MADNFYRSFYKCEKCKRRFALISLFTNVGRRCENCGEMKNPYVEVRFEKL